MNPVEEIGKRTILMYNIKALGLTVLNLLICGIVYRALSNAALRYAFALCISCGGVYAVVYTAISLGKYVAYLAPVRAMLKEPVVECCSISIKQGNAQNKKGE